MLLLCLPTAISQTVREKGCAGPVFPQLLSPHGFYQGRTKEPKPVDLCYPETGVLEVWQVIVKAVVEMN